MTRVLFATSEIAPWVKTGGLGDVSGALPTALLAAGVDVRVLVPAYPQLTQAFPAFERVARIPPLGSALPACELLAAKTPEGLELFLLDCPSLYARDGGPYLTPDGVDWPDNHLRFGLLSRIAAWLASHENQNLWRPQLLHCNDWQSALAPAYSRYADEQTPTVLTIHNLAFQGVFPPSTLAELALPPQAWHIDGVEYYGSLSFLKAGLQFASQLVAVSPTYAREIQTPALGFGLDGLLRWRSQRLSGILHGVDSVWDPATDPYIARKYNARALSKKKQNRQALRAELGLEQQAALPLAAIVSRLTYQKGMDLVLEVADTFLAAAAQPRMQLALLGRGETRFEDGFRALAKRYPGQVAVNIDFSEALAHRIEAGADIFLMPSRFEPCGLNQLYSLRYGTPPVVHATGGLADTVVDCMPQTLRDGTANGFAFAKPEAPLFADALYRAIDAWHDEKIWRRLQKNGMKADFSWDRAASQYLAVYARALEQPPIL